MAKRLNKRWLWAAFIGVPMAFLAAGIWMTVDTIRFLGASKTAVAEVVEIVTTRRGAGTWVSELRPANSITTGAEYSHRVWDEGYTAIVAFDVEGTRVVAPTHIEADSYDFEIGAEVEIRYDPAELGSVRVRGVLSLWAFPVVLTFLGAGMLTLVWFGRDQLGRTLAA